MHLQLRSVFVAATTVLMLASSLRGEVTFDWVTISDPGNPADPLNSGSVPGIGSVGYQYRISRYEVTNAQYVEFLNAVGASDPNALFNPLMDSDARGGISRAGSPGSYSYSAKPNMAQKPVNFVSFFDAMRFANWLHNGQPSGLQDATTTEAGAYTISDGLSEVRSPQAAFFIPSENEWYKAAHYQPAAEGGDADDYWLYPTATNTQPVVAAATPNGDVANPGANVANYAEGADWNGQNGNVTTVGTAGLASRSYYGTADQAGNVREWNEALVGAQRGNRGGSLSGILAALQSSFRGSDPPTWEARGQGFRVASSSPAPPIPAASQWSILVLALTLLIAATRLVRPDTA